MPKLVFTSEHFAGRVYELTLEKTTVGRGGQNTLTLQDKSVSHAHCEILVNGPEVIVRDLDSANGTFVNGLRVSQQGQIKSGQTVRFGLVEARLELEPPKWDDTSSEETAVHAMRRSQRDLRREQARPKPASPSATFASKADGDSTEQTVIVPKTARVGETENPPVTPEAPAQPRRTLIRRAILASVVLVSGLTFLRWLLWRKR
jgi:predicted component of type VI protein secretion system